MYSFSSPLYITLCSLAPHYEEAATVLKEKNIKIAKVDCTVEAELCQEHGISGYPCVCPRSSCHGSHRLDPDPDSPYAPASAARSRYSTPAPSPTTPARARPTASSRT
jgi:hypothetical protein